MRDAAAGLLSVGFCPIRVEPNGKKPEPGEAFTDRTRETQAEEIARGHFDGPCNVGVLLGAPSSGTVDVDLDCPEAIAITPHVLPPTLTFGRASAWISHWLFHSPESTAIKLTDPLLDNGKSTLIEVRSDGQQTVVPPSIHQSGEPIAWAHVDKTTSVERDELSQKVHAIGALSLLVRYFPAEGLRHDTRLAIAGALMSGGMSDDDAAGVLDTIATVTGTQNETAAIVTSTRARLDDGESVKGWGSLAEIYDRRVVSKVREWLGCDDTRPTIRLGPDLHRVVDEACAALGNASDLYERGGDLVRVVRAKKADERRGMVEGEPTIRPVAIATAREELTKVARFVRLDARSGEWRSVLPPDPVVAAVLARGTRPTVRALAGAIDAPCLRHDGSVLSASGYDAATGLILCSDLDVGPIGEPSHEEACAALARLADLYCDFPFTSEAGRFVAVAAILTVLGRAAIDGATPLFAFDAPVQSAGKSLLAHSVGIVCTGRDVPLSTYSPDEETQEKQLSSLAIRGARSALLDNVSRTIEGGPLAKYVSASGDVEVRVLGESRSIVVPWRCVLIATGNGLSFDRDCAERAIVGRIEPQCEDASARTGFKHHPLREVLFRRRAELVRDALTVLRAHALAGRPGDGAAWKDYAAWVRVVRDAILWAGGSDLLSLVGARGAAVDSAREALRIVVGALPSGRGLTVRDLVALAMRTQAEDGGALRDALEVLAPGAREGEPSTKALGWKLTKSAGCIFAGRRLTEHDGRAGAKTYSAGPVG